MRRQITFRPAEAGLVCRRAVLEGLHMTTTDHIVEPRAGAASVSDDGWNLDGIPPRFWPKVREILELADKQRYSAQASLVAGALVNALAIEAIARKAGPAGEALAKSAASFVADWDGDICPPYRKWPPKKKRWVAEEVVDILSHVIDVVPEGTFSQGIRNLGASMDQKLNTANVGR